MLRSHRKATARSASRIVGADGMVRQLSRHPQWDRFRSWTLTAHFLAVYASLSTVARRKARLATCLLQL